MTQSPENQLALSTGLTAKTNQLCLGLESGAADILELVTPMTAELLLWWFGEDMVLARGGDNRGLNFHAGQKQAILNAIVAHEVMGKDHDHWTLLDLYQACAPDARFTRQFMVAAPGLIVCERLLDTFCGKLIENGNSNGNGSRDFASSDIARFRPVHARRPPRTGVCLCTRQRLQQDRNWS